MTVEQLEQWEENLRSAAADRRRWADGLEATADWIRDYIESLGDQQDTPLPDPAPDLSGDWVFGHPIWVWREFSGVAGLGLRAPQMAYSGKGQHIRIIYGNGEPKLTPTEYAIRAERAVADGAVAVVLDLESYMLAAGPEACAAVYHAIKSRVKVPVGWAPKLFLDHLIKIWKKDYTWCARWLQLNGDFLVPWSYNSNAPTWIGNIKQLRSAGYVDPVIALGEWYRDVRHGWKDNRRWELEDLQLLWDAGVTTAGFVTGESWQVSRALVVQSPAYRFATERAR